jgi:hypothetical protein
MAMQKQAYISKWLYMFNIHYIYLPKISFIMNQKLLVIFIFLLACGNDKRKETIDKAIRQKESNKASALDSYTILRTSDSLGILKVYYSAKIASGSKQEEQKDSVIFYELPNGIIEPQP